MVSPALGDDDSLMRAVLIVMRWFWQARRVCLAVLLALVCMAASAAWAAGSSRGKETGKEAPGPSPLLLDGGRRLEYLRSISAPEDVRPRRSWFNRVIDFVAGPPVKHRMVRPYGVATDQQNRIIVTDPGARAVHIFDFKQQKYRYLEGGKEDFKSPIGVAVDDQGNTYVSDSELGKIFVFDARGKFRRYFGDVKGEGYFKRPTGLAVDSTARRLYVTDTLKHAVYTLDLEGHVLGSFGKRGNGDGELNYPTDIAATKDELIVVDALNFRVQIFDRNGTFHAAFGHAGDAIGSMFRSKGLGVDSAGNFYLADGYFDCVQVFNRAGALLYFFGQPGSGAMQFQAPAGVHIDLDDKVYVVDSSNRRVQEFRYVGAPPTKNTMGGQ
jgi:DNA-binding beta-propeller fold protein YncE